MVVGYRGHVPVGAMNVELAESSALNRKRLEPLFSIRVPTRLPVVPDDELPGISVVVPTVVSRVEDLRILCEALTALDYPKFEVVLVDNRKVLPAQDDLVLMASEFPAIRIVEQRVPGISAARNAGTVAARYDVIVFTDDDVRVDPGWLRGIGTRFASDTAIEVVTGLILPAELDTSAQIWLEEFYGGFGGQRSFVPTSVKALPSVPFILRGSRVVATDDLGGEVKRFAIYGVGAYAAGANMGFRRSALERVGGFDTALGTGTPTRGGEDLAAVISVLWTGGQLAFEPTAVAYHRHRRTLKELEEQLYGNGVGWSAYLTSLILADPRHLIGLGWQLPRAIRQVAAGQIARLFSRTPQQPVPVPVADEEASLADVHSYPSSITHQEMRGLPFGPFMYLKTRRRYRRLYPPALPRTATFQTMQSSQNSSTSDQAQKDLPAAVVLALQGFFLAASAVGFVLDVFSGRSRRR